jgi:hypothetical protein
MKMWHIFVVGAAAVVAALLLPLYEFVIAGVGALIVVAVVAFGFMLRPRKDVFYVRTTVSLADHDRNLCLEHDLVAVKVELARLWLLFVPTFLALAFLIVTAANGTVWKFSLLDRLLSDDSYHVYVCLMVCRLLLLVVVGALSLWISERWVIRDADACSARSVSVRDGWVSFMFVDQRGEYYGGEGFPFGLVRPAALATLVLYHVAKPELNKIGMGFLFHMLVIVGRGLTDLDHETVATRTALAGTTL